MSDERREASEQADDLVSLFDQACRDREKSLSTGERSRQWHVDVKNEWETTRAALLTYIASLEADRARLDWLEQFSFVVKNVVPGHYPAVVEAYPATRDKHCFEADSIRAAIDSAMSGSPLAPTQEGA